MRPVHDRASESDDSSSSRPSEPSPIGSGRQAGNGFDPLSDALGTVRLTGALFFLWEASFPFAEPWTLERLADAAGGSRSSLAERFAELLGEPPIRYLTRWRMQFATTLLDRPDPLKVETVAHRVGYRSGAAFSRAFKRVVGVNPTEWRHGGSTLLV